MKLRFRLLALSAVVLLAACHSAMATYPELKDRDSRVVIDFLDHYKHHDIDGMMTELNDDAEFRGSGSTLNKPQIKRFFQQALKKHPDLRIEFGPPQRVRGTVQVQVQREDSSITRATWIFVLKNNKIHSYSIQPGEP